MYTSLTLVAALSLGAPALKDKELPGKGPGYLGVQFVPLEEGMQVREVREGSPALKAGVKVGDIILKLEGFVLKDMDSNEMVKLIASRAPNTVVTLDIKRGNETMTIKVKLAPRPADFDQIRPSQPPPIIDDLPPPPPPMD